ncbi:MAG: nicotinate-nucleotide pyrophosphorylase (carboxylating) [Flavipsychrobacter sp.]|nr:nicotinate-nucleotide pyrophosphorylase (carboxylating) [Flavipsychrobacter sp.]
MTTKEFIAAALKEDIGSGDHSTLAAIPKDAKGKAVLKVKENGILAGVNLAQEIFHFLEPGASFSIYKHDGDVVVHGDTAFEVAASVHTILQAERLSLNCMQRMSGIATLTRKYVDKIKGYKTQILDTRKTTPLFRTFEKEAVRIGGGQNHRMGLYDMIMLKDDVRRILAVGNIHRIMLDNYNPELLAQAVELIAGKYETEASGGININNIVDYAKTGVDFISVGATIHHAVSMDLSLKAQIL